MAIENDGNIKNGTSNSQCADASVDKPSDGGANLKRGAHFKVDNNDANTKDAGTVSVVGSVSLADMSSVPKIPSSDDDDPRDMLDIPFKIEMAAYYRSRVVAERACD